ncbi:MAG TPA: cytochrome c oxidase subunit II [Candidatus Acidoferrales bacterium]|nr:cytochrome c oxidase subunit II [Candidatus Acidoferrales bacterium]
MRGIFLSLFTLLLARVGGCGHQSIFNAAGPASQKIANLFIWVLAVFLIITCVMWALIVMLVGRPRGNFQEHAPVRIGGGHAWVLGGGFAFPAVILFIVFISGLAIMSDFPIHDGPKTAPEIRIVGHQWWWQVEYLEGSVDQHFTTANEIHIPVGRPVDIALASTDVIHSFWVPELHGKVDLIPGQQNSIRIQADRPGAFRGQCAEYCGAQHAHMILLVIADPPEQFESWLSRQRAVAASPTEADAIAGQHVFENRPCGLCHTVRGTEAQGRVGPDLTHFGSRQRLAANMLPNDPADLEAWVTHAQSLKPASYMPNITDFNGLQLREIVAYLQQLK